MIDLFSDDLKNFFDFDSQIDLISSGKKQDGNTSNVYLTDIKKDFLTLAPSQRSVIIKELTPQQARIYSNLSSIFHPNLEKIYAVLEKDGHFISINEFVQAPAKLNYDKRSICLEEAVTKLGCFCERDALIYLCQLCDGLETLHKINLTHNDISPKNILLSDAPAYKNDISAAPAASQGFWMKIIDFDISKKHMDENHAVTTIAGTKPFAAPEILDFRYPTDRVDIYSLGCILHYMLTGKSPKDTAFNASARHFTKNAFKIIQKCTDTYDKRYRNTAELKKAALSLC